MPRTTVGEAVGRCTEARPIRPLFAQARRTAEALESESVPKEGRRRRVQLLGHESAPPVAALWWVLNDPFDGAVHPQVVSLLLAQVGVPLRCGIAAHAAVWCHLFGCTLANPVLLPLPTLGGLGPVAHAAVRLPAGAREEQPAFGGGGGSDHEEQHGDRGNLVSTVRFLLLQQGTPYSATDCQL